jgi:hypothetical protein
MLIEILKHTPVWVWAVLAALLYLGYFQSRPHMLARRRMTILPAALIGFSLFGVHSAFGLSAQALAPWACGVAAALLANRVLRLPREVCYDAATQKFSLPGSYVPMLLMLSIFATKYAVAVAMALDHGLADSVLFAGGVSLAYGIFSGTFVARSLHILASARQSGSTSAAQQGGLGAIARASLN